MRRLALAVSLFSILFVVSNAAAQSATNSTVPSFIRYNGTVLQPKSAAVSSPIVGVTFAIYKQQEGSAPMWLETQNVTLDATGRYSVLLGSTSPTGLPSDLFSPQEPRWLAVKVEGQSEQPRVLLVSVPYAMKAAEADTLAGHSASEFVTTDTLQSAVKEQLQQQTGGPSQARTTMLGVTTNGTVDPYVDNGTALQVGANFNIAGNGTAATLNVTGQYNLGGSPLLGRRNTQGLFLGGGGAGQSNTANYNTFIGYAAGKSNTTGTPVTFIGVNAGYHNTTGSQNFFLGVSAGYNNTTGGNNIFIGNQAGYGNTTGTRNTYLGSSAGGIVTTGSNNTFVGYNAGSTAGTTASNDVYIASPGVAADSGVIRIGDPANQTKSYIAGISGAATSSGVPVFIDSTGKLGTTGGKGIGTITGVTAGTDLTGGGTSGHVTLNLNTAATDGRYAQLGAPNAFSATQSINTSGLALQAFGDIAVSGYGSTYGVLGSGTGSGSTGVYGGANSFGSVGVYGQNLNSGSVGQLGTSVGPFSAGVYGSGTTYGVYGDGGSSGYGVYGLGLFGIYGSGTETGVAGSGTSIGVIGTATGIGTYGVFSNGNTGATGTKSAVVALPDDRVVEVYAMESPEIWFEDFGIGHLHDGVAEITLDSTFALSVNADAGYHVFLTPNGDCEGLYVTQKGPASFQVRELRGGQSNIAFDYRIVAKRRGYENVRMIELEADAETIQSIREQTKNKASARPKLFLHKPPAAPGTHQELPRVGTVSTAPSGVIPNPSEQ